MEELASKGHEVLYASRVNSKHTVRILKTKMHPELIRSILLANIKQTQRKSSSLRVMRQIMEELASNGHQVLYASRVNSKHTAR